MAKRRRTASTWAGRGMAALLATGATAPEVQAGGLLDATCKPGNKLIVTDYEDVPTNQVGRGHDMAAFIRGKNAAGVDEEYLLLPWARDSGKDGGGFSLWNWGSWVQIPPLRPIESMVLRV